MTIAATSPPKRRRRRLVGCIAVLGAFVAIGTVAAAAASAYGGYWYAGVADEAEGLVGKHLRHEVAHPGWSFPAQVYSAPDSLELPAGRRIAAARARGYQAACPASAPGEYCESSGVVTPRSGSATEMEPLLIGLLSGPDGEVRYHLPLDKAPDHLLAALIAAEDESFHDHPGVDVWGLGRAILANVRGAGYHQGGSTLTMQVVRTMTARREKTLSRKVHEMGLAVAVDQELGKEGVLQMYLDAPYLGQQGNLSICGFEAAARHYWGIHAEDLDLAQAATLVAILPAPGRFAPDRNPNAARQRRDRVLRRLGEQGLDVEDALNEPMGAWPHPLPDTRYAAYVQAVHHELLDQLPEHVVYGSGLEVHTALDVVAQARTEETLAERTAYLERTVGRRGPGPLLSAAALVDVRTGRLVAVGDTGLDLATDFNRATQARRQAGSSFKPVVYAMALGLENTDGTPRFPTTHRLPNQWRSFDRAPGWHPRNVGGRYSETSALAAALSHSANIATASLLDEAGGPDPLVRFAERVGYDASEYPHEMGLALGQAQVTPVEQARFVAEIVDGGRAVRASTLVRVSDARGTVLYEDVGLGEPLFSEESAALTRELMRLVVEWGTGGSARGISGFSGIEGPFIGKTGTTDEEKDLWFVGATPDYAGALWLGYDQPTRIGASASDFAAPLWGWWMRSAVGDLPIADDFGGMQLGKLWVCDQTGLTPAPSCRAMPAPVRPGTRSHGVCDGTHPPETGEPMATRQSIWEKLAAHAGDPLPTSDDAVADPGVVPVRTVTPGG